MLLRTSCKQKLLLLLCFIFLAQQSLSVLAVQKWQTAAFFARDAVGWLMKKQHNLARRFLFLVLVKKTMVIVSSFFWHCRRFLLVNKIIVSYLLTIEKVSKY